MLLPTEAGFRTSESFVARHSRIIFALFHREMVTRFGREGLGFLWVIGEPLIFCIGVLIMWSVLKPEYEHGIRLGPFVMTGYMCLLLMRHQISLSIFALISNIGLLHHRQIKVLHLYIARNLIEFVGATAAFMIVYIALFFMGQVDLPANWLLLYEGWLLVGLLGMGTGLILSGLALRYDFVERFVQVLTYMLVPVSGAFLMVEWLPAHAREPFLLIPYPNAIEMVRAGVLGEFVATHYNTAYAFMCAGVMNFFGMILIANARSHVDVE